MVHVTKINESICSLVPVKNGSIPSTMSWSFRMFCRKPKRASLGHLDLRSHWSTCNWLHQVSSLSGAQRMVAASKALVVWIRRCPAQNRRDSAKPTGIVPLGHMDHTWATWVTWVMFIHVHQVGSCMSNGKVCFLAIGRTSGPHQLRMRLGPSGEFAQVLRAVCGCAGRCQ